jgi:hypothetical protein
MGWEMQTRQMAHWMRRSLKGRQRVDQQPSNCRTPFRTPPGRVGPDDAAAGSDANSFERREGGRTISRSAFGDVVRGYPEESSVSSRSYWHQTTWDDSERIEVIPDTRHRNCL